MTTIVTRTETQTDGTAAKGSELTWSEVDTNFINLNDNKVEVSGAIVFAAKAGEALSKGDVVYVSGVSGNEPVVSKADADDASKMPAFGLAEADANLNAAVNIVTFGTLYNIDTSAFSAGDNVYVSTTPGALTSTKPSGEASLLQNLGLVIRSHASAGSIKVGGAGRTNAVPNLNDGNVFIGNASNQAETRALVEADISDLGTYIGLTDLSVTTNAVGTAALSYNNTSGVFSYTPPDLSSYLTAESDTLDSVTGRGATTSNAVTVGNLTSTGIDDNATSTAITIDSSQNVGINQSAPDQLLHVKGPDEAVIKIESTGSQFPTAYDGTPKLQLVPMASNGFTGEASIEAIAPADLLSSTGMWFRAARADNPNNGVYDGGYFTFHDGNQIVCSISDSGIQASSFVATSGGTTALTLDSAGRVSTGENLVVAGDISMPHSGANIDFGGETYGGPHGLNFFTDDTGGTLHWGFYYRTAPDTITLELYGSDKKLLLNTSGELHIDNDVIAFSTTTSDARFKDQVETIDSALDKVMALRGVEYTWNATARKGERDMGLIAQEVEAVIPIIVREKTLSTGEWSDNPTPAKTVDYEKLTAVLIEAVKELKAEVDALKAVQ